MPLNPNVIELAMILDEEGYSALAGEMMMEVGLGREMPSTREPVGVDTAVTDEDIAGARRREPIPADDQLGAAITFLRQRLVEPVRRLAEAEEIGGQLSLEPGVRLDAATVRIEFVDPLGGAVADFQRLESPGESASVDKLDDVLARIISRRG